MYINPDKELIPTDSIVQAIRIRLLWFRDEWRLGPGYGVPYYQDILVKNPSILVVKQRIREALLDVKEVKEIIKLEVKITSDRKCSIEYAVRCPGGEVISEEVSLYG